MPDARSWALLVHHLPARPTRLRVRVWRQLQRLGAMALKNSVYVLPWSDKAHEDFTWLEQEIETAGGEAAVFRAQSVAGATDGEIVAAFRRERDLAYARLAADAGRLCERITGRSREAPNAPAEVEALQTEVDDMQKELRGIEELDFFRSPGRSKAAAAVERARSLVRRAQGRETRNTARGGAAEVRHDRASYMGRLWVTRPRPHIDRCASAWLIRRFIDRRARFAFAANAETLGGGIPFDMSGVEFGHHGEDCTFETLTKRFGLERDAALRVLGEIVHDIDLKDGKFGRPEAPGVDAVLRGLAEGVRDDRRLLREAAPLFDGLYAKFAARPRRGRRNAPSRRK